MSFGRINSGADESTDDQLLRGFDQLQATLASADDAEVDRLLMMAESADLAHDAYALAMEYLQRENGAMAARWFRVAYLHGITEAQELLSYCHNAEFTDVEAAGAPASARSFLPIPAGVTLTDARSVATKVVESATARAEAILTDARERATQLVKAATTVLTVENLEDSIIDAEKCRAERRARLFEAALDEFTSHGYANTTIADLCARAGISSRTFYTRYASKEMLLLELHARINRLAMRRMLAMLDSLAHADVVTRITTLVGAFVEAVTSDPRYLRLTYVEAPGASPAIERQHQDWFAQYTLLIEAQFDRAAEAGLVPQRSYRGTATTLVGTVTERLRAWRTREPSTPPTIIADQIQTVAIDMVTRCT